MIWLNGEQLNFVNFPNGEVKVDGEQILKNTRKTNIITFKYENDSELIKLMFVKRFLDDCNYKANLRILYMPYSRMDRIEGFSVFTLKYISEFINLLEFEGVVVLEPHSDVTPALLDKCNIAFPSILIFEEAMKEVGFNKDTDYIYYPDMTSHKRYSKYFSLKELVGMKERDFETGHIKNLNIYGDVKDKNFKVIMIDDLCSKGGTFILGAKKLKDMGASEIYLVVGHCEDTIYEGDIPDSDLITKVFTTDSLITKSLSDKIIIHQNY